MSLFSAAVIVLVLFSVSVSWYQIGYRKGLRDGIASAR